jgi:hypothetical protein
MGMSDVIKKNWELKEDSASTILSLNKKALWLFIEKIKKYR